MASPSAGIVTASPSQGILRDEGCSLSLWVPARPQLSPLVHLRLGSAAASSQLMPGTYPQPGTGKPHPGTFFWPFTTARLINRCLHARLPGEKLSPLRQVARCQQMQSLLLLLLLFSSAALSQPQWPQGMKGWHSAARRLGKQGARAGLHRGFPGRAIDGRQRKVCIYD